MSCAQLASVRSALIISDHNHLSLLARRPSGPDRTRTVGPFFPREPRLALPPERPPLVLSIRGPISFLGPPLLLGFDLPPLSARRAALGHSLLSGMNLPPLISFHRNGPRSYGPSPLFPLDPRLSLMLLRLTDLVPPLPFLHSGPPDLGPSLPLLLSGSPDLVPPLPLLHSDPPDLRSALILLFPPTP
jgi:hypothetical protein